MSNSLVFRVKVWPCYGQKAQNPKPQTMGKFPLFCCNCETKSTELIPCLTCTDEFYISKQFMVFESWEFICLLFSKIESLL